MRANGLLSDSAAMLPYVYQRFVKDYVRIVDALDDNVGRLLDLLGDDRDLRANTVVSTAGQGYFTGEYGTADKWRMYEEVMRMPLLMRWPGRTPPGTHVDLAPSSLRWPVPRPQLDAGSVGRPTPARRHPARLEPVVLLLRPHRQISRHVGVRTEHHKLIHFYTDDAWEACNFQAGPYEADPAFADELAFIKAEYLRLRAHYEVPASAFVPPYR